MLHSLSGVPGAFQHTYGGIKAVVPSVSRVMHQLAATANTPENWERAADTEANQNVSVFEYQSMFLPWGPEWDAKKYHDLLLIKYVVTNRDKADKAREVRICKCFWSFDLKTLLRYIAPSLPSYMT